MNSPAHRISFPAAMCVVAANMIGTGVFTSLGFQVEGLPSGFAILALWAVGGVCALCGALCYGELAAALPGAAGEYGYLARGFHPAVGFLAGWLSAVAGFAAPVALAAMAFGSYAHDLWPGVPALAASLAVTALATLVHLRGVKTGARFQLVATVFKCALLVAFVAAGFAIGESQPVSFLPAPGDAARLVSAPFATSLIYVMYAYAGWNAATYIAAEVRRPERNVPLALALGTALVAALYLALNAVFLRAAPMAELRGQLDVALVAARHLFGEAGGRIAGGLICLALVSAVSAMTWVGPRVLAAMGAEHSRLRWFAARSAAGVPWRALLAQSSLVAVLLATGSFEAVLTCVQFSLTLSSALAVVAVAVLRVREPSLPRPVRAWGWPVTPLVFLAISGWMLWHVAVEKPRESLTGLGLVLAGLALYSPHRRSH